MSKNTKDIRKTKKTCSWRNKLANKQDLICHVAKVKVATSTHSMADVIPFQRIYYSLPIESFHKTERKYILHTIKIVSITLFMLWNKANKHLRLRDSWLSLVRPSGGEFRGGLRLSTQKNEKKKTKGRL